MYPLQSLRRSPVATGLEVIGRDKGWLISCAWLCLKWSRYVRSQSHFLVPAGLIQRQDKVKTAEDQRKCRSCRKVTNTPACGAPSLNFCLGLLSYTEGSQLPTYTSRIWWHDLFTCTYAYILLNAGRRSKRIEVHFSIEEVDESKSIDFYNNNNNHNNNIISQTMPFWLFNYPTSTTNTIDMLMRKNDL